MNRYLVQLDKEPSVDVPELVRSIKQTGATDVEVLPRISTVFVTGDHAMEEKVRAIKGVRSIRQEKNFQLPPMDDKIPQ